MNSKLQLLLAVIAGVGMALVLSAGTVAAGTLVVDDDGRAIPTDCDDATVTDDNVQDAVDAASPGDTIFVCPGTYTEQVTISTDDINLRSTTPLAAMIQAPASMSDPKAIVFIDGAIGVVIHGFTITGPGGGTCDSIRFGVRLDDNASAVIDSNHVTSIRDEPLSGCQNGRAISVVGSSAATVQHNAVDDYQKNGIDCRDSSTSCTIIGNTVTGAGMTTVNAQNGIVIILGATGVVNNNLVADNFFTGAGPTATGILVAFGSSDVVVNHNAWTNNETAIFLFGNDSVANANTIDPSTFGIILFVISTEPTETASRLSSMIRNLMLELG